jgi:probable phosphoglycerate mutase
MLVLLVRHGPTDWNRAQRLQGRSDRPLDPEGRAAAAGWTLPERFRDVACLSSPLARAVETARLIGFAEPVIEPALTELDWGAWEGLRLADLRAADPQAIAALEARGLDFRPPGGESYREVQARAWPVLAARDAPTVVVTHRGVMLACLAQAPGWSMTGEPPVRLGLADALELRSGAGGEVATRALALA